MKLALNFDTIQGVGLPNFKFGLGTAQQPSDVINAIVPYVFAAAGIALLVYLVMGGLQMMTSKGDPKAMQGAQAKITNALLGFVIVFVSYWIVQLFGKILGLQNFF